MNLLAIDMYDGLRAMVICDPSKLKMNMKMKANIIFNVDTMKFEKDRFDGVYEGGVLKSLTIVQEILQTKNIINIDTLDSMYDSGAMTANMIKTIIQGRTGLNVDGENFGKNFRELYNKKFNDSRLDDFITEIDSVVDLVLEERNMMIEHRDVGLESIELIRDRINSLKEAIKNANV